MGKLSTTAAIAALTILPHLAFAMATEQVGPDQPDRPTIAQNGWPRGIEHLLRHPSRAYSNWVNGNENFYFKASPEQINELLDLFAKTRLRDHEVKLEVGPRMVMSLRKQEFEYNVSLPVLSGIALFMSRRNNDDQTLEPAMTIYLDEGGEMLRQLKLPENVIVTGAIDVPQLEAKRTLPARKAWHGRIELENDDPAAMERGISTRITLWQKDQEDGIELATGSREGTFKVIFSDEEIAAMQKGDSWLTVTVGNFMTAAKKDDAKYPVESLAQEPRKAQARKIAALKYYYGRILFADGAPPVLEPRPWPGAEISVSFPFAGPATPDAEGYFQVYFDPAQFEQLLKRKPQKNIYIPNKENGSSTAREAFPPELLSQDKSKAGVVKIPRPTYGPGA